MTESRGERVALALMLLIPLAAAAGELRIGFDRADGTPASYRETGVEVRALCRGHLHLGDVGGDPSGDLLLHSGCERGYGFTFDGGDFTPVRFRVVSRLTGAHTFTTSAGGRFTVADVAAGSVVELPSGAGWTGVHELVWSAPAGTGAIDDLILIAGAVGAEPSPTEPPVDDDEVLAADGGLAPVAAGEEGSRPEIGATAAAVAVPHLEVTARLEPVGDAARLSPRATDCPPPSQGEFRVLCEAGGGDGWGLERWAELQLGSRDPDTGRWLLESRPVGCGDVVAIELLAPASAGSRDRAGEDRDALAGGHVRTTGTAPQVGIEMGVRAETVVLRVVASDGNGEREVAVFDPAVEPSPACAGGGGESACCPMLVPPSSSGLEPER